MDFVVPTLEVVVLAALVVGPTPVVLDQFVHPVDPTLEFEADPIAAADDVDDDLPIAGLVVEFPILDFVEFLGLPILDFVELLDLPMPDFEYLVYSMLDFEFPEFPKIEVVGPIECFDLVGPIGSR